MQDLDRELEGMKENVMGLQVWDPDSTSYFQADGTDPYSYVDGIDPYSYSGGENVQKLFDFIEKNKEQIGAVGGTVRGLSSGGTGGECKGLFGGKLKKKLGLCQDAPAQDTYVAPKSNTGLYIGIGVGILAIGIVAIVLIKRRK